MCCRAGGRPEAARRAGLEDLVKKVLTTASTLASYVVRSTQQGPRTSTQRRCGQTYIWADPHDILKLEALGIGDVRCARPSQRRLAATADQNRRNVGHHPIDQTGGQERAGQGRPALEQDGLYPPLAERLEQQLQVQAAS